MASTKATKAITIEADSKSATTIEDGAVITEASDLQSTNEVREINQPLFRAVGIVKGEVKFSDEEKNRLTVTISKFEYGIECKKRHSDALSGLKKEIASTGQTTQRLIVYPKVMHFPRKEMPHKIWFQLIGFDQGRYETGISTDLADNEFKLCGLWQFIPVLWKDSPVRPFRFNPKGGKEQGHPFFVQIKAAFLPYRDAFGFVEQLEDPIEQAPLFMKLPKSVKGQVRNNSSPQPKKKPGQKAKPNLTNKIINNH